MIIRKRGMKMEENNRNLQLQGLMTQEFYPLAFDESFDLARTIKLPLSELSTLGLSFGPLKAAFEQITKTGTAGGGSGLYKVTLPGGPGKKLAKFKKENKYLGTVIDKTGIAGQARLTPVPTPIDPATLFMAAALHNIDQKMDLILEGQKEIIQFLEEKEKSQLRGNLNVLSDVLNNYKHNWNNEKYKNNKHILVQEIKRDAEHSLLFYRKQIENKISKKTFLHGEKDVTKRFSKVMSYFKEYQLSLYLFSFSTFLEVMLLENFSEAYLDSVVQKTSDYAYQYRGLYTQGYSQIEAFSKSSRTAHVLSGLSKFNRLVGEAVAKVPVVNQSQLDETLTRTSEKLKDFNANKTSDLMQEFQSNRNTYVTTFIDNINTVNTIHNKASGLLLNEDSVFLELSE